MTQNNNTSRINQNVSYLLTYPNHRTKTATNITINRIGTRNGTTYGTCKLHEDKVSGGIAHAVELVEGNQWKVVG